jgi:hypothetical protein
MADQSDVETTLVDLIAAILYPRGTAAPSILGRLCRVYRGWPHSAALDEDLAAGHVNITVFPDQRHEHVTTRFPAEFQIVTQNIPSYTVSVTGNTATVGGSPGGGQLVGLLVGQLAVVHRTAATDSPALVASILAAQLATQRLALVAGAIITMPGAAEIVGRVVADQTAQSETRRQLQSFRVSLWCPDPATRDACASAIDAALSALDFIALPDGTSGRLLFRRSIVLDRAENAALFRRDLFYTVDYATTVSTTLPAMLFGDAAFTPNGGPLTRNCLG